jgi:hypothetical protein
MKTKSLFERFMKIQKETAIFNETECKRRKKSKFSEEFSASNKEDITNQLADALQKFTQSFELGSETYFRKIESDDNVVSVELELSGLETGRLYDILTFYLTYTEYEEDSEFASETYGLQVTSEDGQNQISQIEEYFGSLYELSSFQSEVQSLIDKLQSDADDEYYNENDDYDDYDEKYKSLFYGNRKSKCLAD